MMDYPFPTLDWSLPEKGEVLKRYVQEKKSTLDKIIENKEPARFAIEWRTNAIDKLLIGLFEQTSRTLEADQNHYAMIAQGGYGRRELSYHSDIDLLFLHNSQHPKKLKAQLNQILYPLWDSGLDLGFAVRTEKECLKLMKDDLTILTSLIDARYIVGNETIFNSFEKKFRKHLDNSRFRISFMQKKEKEQTDRLHRFGGSVFLQEPNTKEGKGGLREYHHIHWVTKTVFNTNDLSALVRAGWIKSKELRNLQEAITFILAVRNMLHKLSGRKTDQILYEHKAAIAEWLGFKDTETILAVEDFMRAYYRHASECFRISEQVNRKLLQSKGGFRLKRLKRMKKQKFDEYFNIENKFLTLGDPDAFKLKPSNLIYIFRIMQQTGITPGRSVKEAVRDSLKLINDDFRANPTHAKIFREMLAEPETIAPPMLAMHELGVLDRFLPEFKNLMYRAQHDVYHVYTVDIHSILAVGVFGRLVAGIYQDKYPTATEVAKAIVKKDLLSFAILYHDIGKGEGSGHVEKGAPLVRRAAERLGFTPDEIDTSEFLELSHLMMTHLAFRRDLDDPNLILQFAKSMATESNLNKLYVLTFSDVKAVSQEALTKWKESLLEYLYLKARSVLKKGDFSKEKIEEIKSSLLENTKILANSEFSDDEINHFFSIMPPRYFLTATAVSILDHLDMLRRFNGLPVVFNRRILEKEGSSEWTLLTLDTPGLFSKICGVVAANSLNITEAYLNTTNDGKDLFIFKLQTAQGQSIAEESKWNKLEADVLNVVQGEIPLQELLGNRLRPSLIKPKTARQLPTKVVIDNDLSPFYTIIDVYAHDRVGLLYHITSALAELGLYVDMSKIATKVDQVTDTFYVRDIFGQKLRAEDRIKRVRKTLLSVIDGVQEESQEVARA